MIERVKETINKYSMLEKGDKVIIGVSGGPDSVALLSVLNKLKKQYDLSLYVVHINYHLRGDESNKDEEFVVRLARKFKVPVILDEIKTKNLPRKQSLQDFARQVRYQIYLKTAKAVKAGKIALGHNQDDQAETVMMRFIRGAGLEGLSGIPATRDLSFKIKIIRPLINCKRAEIEEYLKKQKLKFKTDSSNLKPVYLRNKLRLNLIPLIEREYNPKFKDNLIKLSEILNKENGFLSYFVSDVYKRIVKRTSSGILIKMKDIVKLHPALTLRVLREAVKDVKGDLLNIEYKHLEDIVSNAQPRKINLPHGIIVEKYGGNIIFRKEAKKRAINSILKINGKTYVNGLLFLAKIVYNIKRFKGTKNAYFGCLRRGQNNIVSLKNMLAYFDLGKIKLPIYIRTRKTGERFVPFGMKGTKKLQDFFVNEKVPEYKRDDIPILTDDSGKILWVAGYRTDDRFKITRKTKEILHVKLVKNKDISLTN